jgi:peptidoglycan hydrolase-like protein with peptidoglycan-binding domain
MNDIKDFINMTSLYSEYTLLEATSQEIAKGLYNAGAGKVFGTDEKTIFALLDQIKSKEEFDAVVKSYKVRARGDDLITDLRDEMSGQELATLNSVLTRVSADNFGTAPGTPADIAARAAETPPAAADADADDPRGDQTNPPAATPAAAETPPPAAETPPPAASTTDTAPADDDNPRPTGNEEGDPYGIKNAQQAVDNGQSFRLADLNRAKQDLASDQAEWDAENPGQVPPTTADTINTDTSTVKFDNIGAAMVGRDQVVPGQTVEIAGEKAIAAEYDKGGIYYVDMNGRALGTDAADAETPATTADADADDPRGDQTNPPAATPSNGSLLGRKLDLTTPNIMKAYNDGGKQAMPTIKNMQTALSRLGFDPNGLDGKYGNGTFKAVQEFQKANGLAVDGQAGPSTMAAIKKALDDNFDANKVTPADSAQAAAPTVQTASKDNNMNKNKINEASMNISMNGNDASEVADLVKLLQNAGMPQASPVSDIPMQMPKAMPTPHDHDSHDNMKSMMTLMSEPEDTSCGEDCGCESCTTEDTSEYDAVVSEWDNSPEEEYSDVSAVIPDGDDLHKSKKPYPAVDGGDNAMALESIKETLWAALQEKTTVEGRGRGKKMKLKASRGNEDIKTTEGSRGKKSRGKKSRG